jgi:hypothetical protein
MVLNSSTQRETGKTAQLGNIGAAGAVSDIVRSTLGPRAMLKMLLDPMGGIVITNDGNCECPTLTLSSFSVGYRSMPVGGSRGAGRLWRLGLLLLPCTSERDANLFCLWGHYESRYSARSRCEPPGCQEHD